METIPTNDSFAMDDTVTIPNLIVQDEDSIELESAVGFDPYDTARFSRN